MTNRAEYLKAINKKIERGNILVFAGVGCGLTAIGAESGGADMIITYNTAVYRIQGVPTAMAFLPYDDCNKLAFDTAPQVIGAVKSAPVMIGIGAHDPRRNISSMIKKAEELGVSGVTNEPFIGMYEGDLRKQMEKANLGFEREVQLIKTASQAGLVTLAYVFTPEEAVKMSEAGADFIGAMVGGVTSGGPAGGAETVDLSEAIIAVSEIVSALKNVGRNVPVLIHGGPLNDIEPVREVINKTGAIGYITGSTGERIPTAQGVKEKICSFSAIRKENNPF
ncbi:MAG: phosphoenolpyruvate hydrolase family protein [Christensenellaceae bacterium]